jgi:perosamine synthetase
VARREPVGVVTLPPLPYGRQTIDDSDVAAVGEQLRGDWLTQGPKVAEFEEALTEITGAKYAVALSSGTAALHLASLAAGVRPGTQGLTSDVTFVASANGIRYAGGAPTLVDVDPATGLMDAGATKAALAALPSLKVVVPVDLAGTVADLPAFQEIARKAGALVIEDASHSLGATYTHEGQTFLAAGCAHADMAVLSFHPVKLLTTGEGGAICTNDESLRRELLELRTHGITRDAARMTRNDGPWYYEQRTLGFNYRITDIQCALGVSQARRFPRFVARRRELAALYDERLKQLGDRIAPLQLPKGAVSAYHLYVVRLVPLANETNEGVAARRLALYLSLRDDGIFPQVHYIPVHRQPDFVANGLSSGNFDGAERYYAGCLSLPLFPNMTDADVERVMASLQRFFARQG